MNHTIVALTEKGYKLRRFKALNRGGRGIDPVGVALFERRGQYYESVVYERFGHWLYATPETMPRGER